MYSKNDMALGMGTLLVTIFDLVIDPGYDGVYGVVKIWNHGESVKEEKVEAPQLGLFD